MRWCYKTVHYELKKEGLLGSSFLDEAEVEQSLNEYGLAGWELVSVMETQDGIITIFKQPLDVKPAVSEKPLKFHRPVDVEDPEDLITEEDIIYDFTEEEGEDQADAEGIDNDTPEKKISNGDGLNSIRIE